MKTMNKSWMLLALCALCTAMSAQAETPEELLTRIEQKLKQLKSWELTSTTTSKSEYMNQVCKTRIWVVVGAESYRMRSETESSLSMSGMPGSQQSRGLAVTDGQQTWLESESDGQVTVVKSKLQTSPAHLSRELLGEGEVTVKAAAIVNGEQCAVLEVANASVGMTTTHYYSEQSGLLLKMVMSGDEVGETIMLVTDVKLNAPIGEDRLEYSPPAGAQVLDQAGG